MLKITSEGQPTVTGLLRTSTTIVTEGVTTGACLAPKVGGHRSLVDHDTTQEAPRAAGADHSHRVRQVVVTAAVAALVPALSLESERRSE